MTWHVHRGISSGRRGTNRNGSGRINAPRRLLRRFACRLRGRRQSRFFRLEAAMLPVAGSPTGMRNSKNVDLLLADLIDQHVRVTVPFSISAMRREISSPQAFSQSGSCRAFQSIYSTPDFQAAPTGPSGSQPAGGTPAVGCRSPTKSLRNDPRRNECHAARLARLVADVGF